LSQDFSHLSAFGKGERLASVGLLLSIVTLGPIIYAKRKGTLNSLSRSSRGRAVVGGLAGLGGLLLIGVGLAIMVATSL